MYSETNLEPTSSVSCAEAQAELERVLADPRFHGTDRTRNILRYLGERRVDGHNDSVKAYAIALDILGRPADFDPSIDPIVRIEMSRLRSSLAQYYEAFGDDTNVSIQLPKGNYVALFSHTGDAAEPADAAIAAEEWATEQSTAADTAQAADVHRPQVWVIPGIAIAALSLIALGACWYALLPSFTDKPAVTVTMLAADDRLKGEASLARDMLLTALTQFQTLTVATKGHDGNSLASLSSFVRAEHGNTYDIELKYYGDGNDRDVWWQIADAGSGDLLKSGLERVSADGKAALGVREELVALLSRRFAAARGVINTIETGNSADGALGNACVLRAEADLDDERLSDLAGAAACLERTISRDAANSDATAALARIILAQAGGKPTEALLQRALDLASRAVSLAPLSDRAQIALMMVQFHSGRIQAAISAGNRALALNPNNPDVSANLATVLFSAGYWDAGVSLAHDAGHAVDAVPPNAALVLALDAYRRGDWSSALLLAEQINRGGLVVSMLKTASLAELGSDQAADRLAEVRSIRPDFERRYAELMAARGYDAGLADSLGAGLVKAGARIAPRSVAASF